MPDQPSPDQPPIARPGDADEAGEDHETDKAELEARDRAQPTRIGREVNLRADGDAYPDRDEREELVEEVVAEREEPTEHLAEGD